MAMVIAITYVIGIPASIPLLHKHMATPTVPWRYAQPNRMSRVNDMQLAFTCALMWPMFGLVYLVRYIRDRIRTR